MSDPQTADPTLEAAVAHHRAGRLAEAEQGYRAALAADPAQARAAHNLGVLLQARQQLDEAIRWFAVATAADPQGPWWTSQVKALIGAGRFQQAEDLLKTRGEQSAAADALEVGLRQRWAFALMREGELDAAEAQFLQVQAISPNDPHVLADLGFVQLQQGRHEAARDTLEAALAAAPGDVRTLTNLGTALLKLGLRGEAEARYREALALEPDNSAARLNLKNLGAEPPVADAADAGPSVPRADALASLGRLDEALLEYLDAAKAARSPEILTKIGGNLSGLGRYDEGLAWLDEAVALAPGEAKPRYERSFVRLAVGDFVGGWDDYERRWEVEDFRNCVTRIPPALREAVETDVERESLKGADVLLLPEQGVGDEIMFASMIPDLAADAASVVCACEPRLVRLFASSFPGVAFTPKVEPDPGRRVLAMGSLGRLYRRSRDEVPGTPFLKPGAAAVERWAAKLGPRPQRLRIGLSWRGGVRQTRMHQRSLDLAQLKPLLDLPGCDYVSLQYGDPREEVEAVNAGLANPVRLFPRAEIDDFEELAGLVENLDVVVSVQNTLVHLSGGLGRRCLVMVPHRPEWRYGTEGEAMAWYRSVTLLRQPQPEAWEPVIARVREALLAP